MKDEIGNFKGIIVRKFLKNDIRKVKKFQNFIDSLVKEKVQISVNKKTSLKEEKEWICKNLKGIKKNKIVSLIAEDKNKIIGLTSISLRTGRMEHVGELGISIRRGYRRIGLGSYLMNGVLKLAKKELKPRPKIIRLSVFPTNVPAISLYKKFGFKKVAEIPKQIKYKGKLWNEVIMLRTL